MADMKLADLTAGTADGTDIVYAVKDPSGTPLDRKLTLSTVKDYITGAANLFTTAQTISPLTDVQGLTVRGGPAGTVNILQLQDSANNLLVAFDKDGLLTLGRGSGLTGQLKFSNATNNNLVTLQAGTTSGNITFTLPTADGTSGQVLQTNGSGVLSWKTDATTSPAGSDTQLQFNNSGSFGADSTLTFNNTSKLLTANRFSLSGNISSAAWTTSGIRYANVAGTITDTSSSGTVATAYTNVYGGNTIAASNSTTFTNYYNTFIAAPVSGTNVTFTNAWALGLGGALNVAAGSYTTDQSALNITQTWNNAGVTFTGLKVNVTDTNSNGVSALLDAQVGGTRKAAILKDGSVIGTLGFWVSAALSGNQSNNQGIGFFGNNVYFAANTSSSVCMVSQTGFQLNSSNSILFSSGGVATTGDLILSRRGAANLRLGAADAAAPVAQTLSVQSVVAGTSNTAGTNFTITGSQGTGTGAGGSIIFQVAPAGSSGTSQNALATALTIDSAKNATFINNILMSNSDANFAIGSSIYGYIQGGSNIGNFRVKGAAWEINDTELRVAVSGGTAFLGFSGSTGVAGDVRLYRDAADTLAQYRTTNAQTYRIYNTYTSSTNYERGKLEWSGSVFNIGTEKGSGGGSAQAMALQTDGTNRLIISTAGLLQVAGTTSSFPALKRSSTTLQVRLADDSADAPINALSGTFTDNTANTSAISSTGYSLTGSSSVSLVDLAGTWNTTGTPSAIKLNITDTASNASSLLLELGTTVSAVYGAKFTVSKVGKVTANSLTVTGDISSAAWTTNGIRYSNVAGTFTDTTSSGTVANAYTNAYGGNTIAASNSVTFTNYYTTYINAPTNGTNVSFTNTWALGVGGNLKLGPDASGTDQAGTNVIIAGSRSTGTGAGGNLTTQTAYSAKSTGSTANTFVARDVIVAKGKVLTDATATSLFEVALPTLTMCGGTITATTVCTDGTDMQSITEVVTFSAVNKGGVYTTDIDVGTTSSAISGGTLANTWTVLTGTNKITIQLSSDTSLTPSSNSFLVYYQIKNNSEQAITVV